MQTGFEWHPRAFVSISERIQLLKLKTVIRHSIKPI